MNLRKIMKLIPESLIKELSKKYKTDLYTKKLDVRTFLSVILYSMFSEKSFSLRQISKIYSEYGLIKGLISNKEDPKIHHTAFHYRLEKLDPEFFKELYNALLQKAKKLISPMDRNSKEKINTEILRFDSTMVSLSKKLLKGIGFKSGGRKDGDSRQIKFTVGYGELVEQVNLYLDSTYNNENNALGETIQNSEKTTKILVFDRGLNDRTKLDKIGKENYYITRMKNEYKIKVKEEKKLTEKTSTLELQKSITGNLYKRGKAITQEVRVIHCRQTIENIDKRRKTAIRRKLKSAKNKGKSFEDLLEEERKIIFLTNIPETKVKATEITELYRKRWDIELLFKFLKQELHFGHLVNRTENGIMIILYITMIFLLLLLLYKKLNNLKGYRYVKGALLREMEEEYLKYVIKASEGSYKRWKSLESNFWEQIRS